MKGHIVGIVKYWICLEMEKFKSRRIYFKGRYWFIVSDFWQIVNHTVGEAFAARYHIIAYQLLIISLYNNKNSSSC